MLSATAGASISAIERFLAAILLTIALGGTAAFAHHVVGSPTASEPLRLTAPQRQHESAPGPVWAPLSTPVRPLTRPAAQAPPATPTPARASAPAPVAAR